MATIVTRVGKGSALTTAEVDANFTNLNTELLGKQGALGYTAANKAGDTFTGAVATSDAGGFMANSAAKLWTDSSRGRLDLYEGAAQTKSLRLINANGYGVVGMISAENLELWTNGTARVTIGGTTGNAAFTGRINSVGFSTSWGVTDAATTGALNSVMGTTTGATWLVSGTSGGVFRGGVQVLDGGGQLRIYEGTNYLSLVGGAGTINTNAILTSANYSSYAQTLDADLTAIAALAGTTGLLKKTAANTWALDTATYLTGITSGNVTTALGFTPYNATNPSAYITASASITGSAATLTTGRTIALTGDVTYTSGSFNGSANVTGAATLANSGVTAGTYPKVTVDAKGRVTVGSALLASDIPALTLENLPDAWVKRSVRVATTANITLSGAQTIDGIAVVAGDRVLVKDQTTTAANGIYVASATAWTRAADADTASELAGALVNVDLGTVNGGAAFDSDLRSTDTLGTTAITWNRLLDSSTIGVLLQAYDADLTAIAALAGTTGFLKKTAANTWALDTATYLTGNQSVSVTGDATGSGATAITLTLATVAAAGTYRSVTVNVKGLVTAGTNPTTLAGYGITDAQALDADLTAIAALAGTTGFLKKTAAGAWALDTSVYLTGITSGNVTTALGFTPYNATNPTGYITASASITGNAATATSATTATNLAGGLVGTVPYQTAAGATAQLAAGTSGYVLRANGAAAPSWAQLDMSYLPDSALKKGVRCATTANITLSAPQTIDGIAVVAGDRVLVKAQTTASQNGIYVVAAAAWTRALDADVNTKMGAAFVGVDTGTAGGGDLWTTTFKATDTLGTTAMNWYEVVYNTGTWAISTTGSAATLTTARTIGGVSFNGSANINLPGVNAAGTQSTTGNAATATKLAGTNWSVEEVSLVLYFKYGGVNKAKLDSSGNFTVLGNVTAYGTV